jgi:hypothetical protein
MMEGCMIRRSFAQAPGALGAALCSGLLALPAAWAQPEPYRYPDADLKLGEQLIREHQCDECHARRVGGDGSAIYRPRGRINNPPALRGMVDYCSVELKLSLFPEEVTAIAGVLQRDHYKFPAAGR